MPKLHPVTYLVNSLCSVTSGKFSLVQIKKPLRTRLLITVIHVEDEMIKDKLNYDLLLYLKNTRTQNTPHFLEIKMDTCVEYALCTLWDISDGQEVKLKWRTLWCQINNPCSPDWWWFRNTPFSPQKTSYPSFNRAVLEYWLGAMFSYREDDTCTQLKCCQTNWTKRHY